MDPVSMAAQKSQMRAVGAHDMSIGARIRTLREQKGFSQGDIERLTGLLRCSPSRVQNGHPIPSLKTLERFAAALDVPLYRLFYVGEDPPPTSRISARKTLEELAQSEGKEAEEARFLLKLKTLLDQVTESDRQVVLALAKKLASR